MSVSVWDYVKAINRKVKNERFGTEDLPIEDYNPFLVGRAFSHYADTVSIANLVNRYGISKKQHFRFLDSLIPKANRFRAWPSRKKRQDIIDGIMSIFSLSEREAFEVLALVGEERIVSILEERKKREGGKE